MASFSREMDDIARKFVALTPLERVNLSYDEQVVGALAVIALHGGTVRGGYGVAFVATAHIPEDDHARVALEDVGWRRCDGRWMLE